jgi:hypothetical protein
MICPNCKFIFKSPGAVKGGKASKRKLTRKEALAMIAARERRRRKKK